MERRGSGIDPGHILRTPSHTPRVQNAAHLKDLEVLKGHGDLDQGHLTNAHYQEALVAIVGKARKINIVETNKYHQSHHAL